MTINDFKVKVLPVSNKLLHFAIWILKNEDKAKDVIQDVFLKLWQKRGELEKVQNIEAFAMRMVRNQCFDMVKLNRSISIDDENVGFLNEKRIDLNENMDLSESAKLVRKAIRKLPELQCKVMWLRDIEQYEYEEITKMTNLTINAVRVNISRARKKVRDELLKYQNYGIERSEKIVGEVL